MRFKQLIAFAATLAGVAALPASAGTNRGNQHVAVTQIDVRPCLFFQLQGVSEADPVVPSAPWFAISTSNPNYQTLASKLLSAKLSNQPLNVQTDGSTSCGYATAAVLGLN